MRLQHLPLAILSLLISVGLWVYVRAQPNSEAGDLPKGTFFVDVVARGLPSDFTVSKMEPSRIIVAADGTQDEIARLTRAYQEDQNLFTAWVDLSKPVLGESSYPLSVQLPKGFNVQWRSRKLSVQVTLDQLTSKTFPVMVEITNMPPDGFLSEHQETDPSTVTVEGPWTKLKEIDHARVLLDLSQIQPGQTVQQTVELVTKSHGRSPLTPKPNVVTILAALSPRPSVAKVLVFPTIVGQPQVGYKVSSVETEPTQITLRGAGDLLAKTVSVDTDPISIAGLKATQTFAVRLNLPPGLRQASPGPIRVTVRVVALPPAPVNPSPTPSATPLR